MRLTRSATLILVPVIAAAVVVHCSVGCSNPVAQECAKDRATFSVDFTCMTDDDCCTGWSCVAGERTDGMKDCVHRCSSNADCTLAAGSDGQRKYCNSYPWGSICDSVPPGIGGTTTTSSSGSGGQGCCADGFCCAPHMSLCCADPQLGLAAACCPFAYNQGLGMCDQNPPCYQGEADAMKHCTGLNINGHLQYSIGCPGS